MKAWGGGEKWHCDMACSFSQRGYDVMVISNIRSELKNRINECNIKAETMGITNLSFLNPFKVLRTVRLLRKNKIDIIIINLSADLKIAGIASRIAGLKRVIYRKGSAIPIRNTFLNRLIYKYLVDDIIANSNETAETILSKNPGLFDKERIHVIYNGIDLKLYKTDEEANKYRKSDDELIIGNAGRMVFQKGQKYLLEIAVILKSRGIPFKMLIAGDGRLSDKLKNSARELGLEKDFLFLGFVKDIPGFMRSIDIFVLTSLWEGFGYVLVEAMALKKPVVAFNVSSNPEIVEDNKTGYLITPFDTEIFADKIGLLTNKTLRNSMGIAGREKVEKMFTIQRTADKLEKMLFDS